MISNHFLLYQLFIGVRRPSFAEIGHRLKIWYQNQKRSEWESFEYQINGVIISKHISSMFEI